LAATALAKIAAGCLANNGGGLGDANLTDDEIAMTTAIPSPWPFLVFFRLSAKAASG
jgi:hypothetical protein